MTMFYKVNKKHANGTFPREFFVHAPVVVIRVSSRSARVYVVEEHEPGSDGFEMGCYSAKSAGGELFAVPEGAERITKKAFHEMTGEEG
jgi:hypothetical protein